MVRRMERENKGKRDENYSRDERQMDLCDGLRVGRMK